MREDTEDYVICEKCGETMKREWEWEDCGSDNGQDGRYHYSCPNLNCQHYFVGEIHNPNKETIR